MVVVDPLDVVTLDGFFFSFDLDKYVVVHLCKTFVRLVAIAAKNSLGNNLAFKGFADGFRRAFAYFSYLSGAMSSVVDGAWDADQIVGQTLFDGFAPLLRGRLSLFSWKCLALPL